VAAAVAFGGGTGTRVGVGVSPAAAVFVAGEAAGVRLAAEALALGDATAVRLAAVGEATVSLSTPEPQDRAKSELTTKRLASKGMARRLISIGH
jgi:hypothetical protein